LEESLRYILLMIRLRCRDVFELTRNDLVIRNNLIIDFINAPARGEGHHPHPSARRRIRLKLQTQIILCCSARTPRPQTITPAAHHHKRGAGADSEAIQLYSVIGGWKNDNLFFCIIPYRDEAHANKFSPDYRLYPEPDYGCSAEVWRESARRYQ
jgi:hypothetical protein